MTTDNHQTPYLMSIPKAAKHFGIGEKTESTGQRAGQPHRCKKRHPFTHPG